MKDAQSPESPHQPLETLTLAMREDAASTVSGVEAFSSSRIPLSSSSAASMPMD